MADIDDVTDEQLNSLSEDDLKKLSETGSIADLSDEGLTAIAGGSDISPSSDTHSIMTAGLKSAANMSSGGYYPQIKAALVTGKTSGPEYEAAKLSAQKELEDAARTAPGASMAGNVVGAVASPLNLLPMAGAKYLGAAGEVAGGAIAGGSINPGEGGDAIQERIKNAALGGTLSAAGAATGPAEGSLKDFASRRAFKALGPYQRQVMTNANRMESIGRTALDEGILSGLPSYEKISERADKLATQKGKDLDNLIDELTEKLKSIRPGNDVSKATENVVLDLKNQATRAGVDRQAIAKAVIEKLTPKVSGVPGSLAKNSRVKKLIEEFSSNTPELMTPRQSEDLKRAIGKEINWKRDPRADVPLQEQVNRQLYSNLAKGSEDASKYIANQLGGDYPERFKNLKESYGNLNTAADISDIRSQREFANRIFSPSDYGAGAAGAIIGELNEGRPGALYGIPAAILNKFLRTYGNQLTAKGVNTVAQAIGSPELRGLVEGSVLNESVDSKRKNRLKALEK